MDLKDLLPIGVGLIVLGLVVAFGLQIMGDVRSDMTGSDEEGAVNDTIEGVAKITTKLPIIVTVVVAAVIIGVLLKAFVFR